MKLHIITVGEPKLPYAQSGWNEYVKRLGRLHQVRTTHIANKYAYDPAHISSVIGSSYCVVMEITGTELDSHQLAEFLEKRALEGREVCFVIGGPDGLPQETVKQSLFKWSLSPLTFPHDLAMVVTAEALYRASTINANHPYHHG